MGKKRFRLPALNELLADAELADPVYGLLAKGLRYNPELHDKVGQIPVQIGKLLGHKEVLKKQNEGITDQKQRGQNLILQTVLHNVAQIEFDHFCLKFDPALDLRLCSDGSVVSVRTKSVAV